MTFHKLNSQLSCHSTAPLEFFQATCKLTSQTCGILVSNQITRSIKSKNMDKQNGNFKLPFKLYAGT